MSGRRPLNPLGRTSKPLEVLPATEQWFLRNGLPYFVPAQRAAARSALAPKRLVPLVLLVGLVAVGAAVGLTWLSEDVSFAPATLTLIAVVATVLYALTALRARPILTFALNRTVVGVRQLLPMVTRALPLLLVFVTFLFINAEVWQMSSYLDGGLLWLTVLLFVVMAVVFMLVRLPEEVDKVDDRITLDLLVSASARTPIAEASRRLVAERGAKLDLAKVSEVPGLERTNLILVLLVIQASQVLLLALSVFAFFIIFGALTMNPEVVSTWIGGQTPHSLDYLPNLSVELLQVSVFLSAFTGLYFTVYVVTDDVYREQFFSGLLAELERAVAVRAVYLLLLADDGLPGEVAELALP